MLYFSKRLRYDSRIHFEPGAASQKPAFRRIFYGTGNEARFRVSAARFLMSEIALCCQGGENRLIGFAIGLVCGAIELFLLKRLTLALQNGKSLQTLGLVLLKILFYACALVPVALFFRRDLIWCGVGISSVLIIGAFILNILSRKSGKGDH